MTSSALLKAWRLLAVDFERCTQRTSHDKAELPYSLYRILEKARPATRIDSKARDLFNYRSDGELMLMLILLRALIGYTPGPGTPGGNCRLSNVRASAAARKFDALGGNASGLLPRAWPGTIARCQAYRLRLT